MPEGEDVKDKLRLFVSLIGRAEGTNPELPEGKNVVEKGAFSGDRNGWSRVAMLPPTTRGFHRRTELPALFRRSKALMRQQSGSDICGKDCTGLHGISMHGS
jgi:hypothetical protein